MIDDYETIDYHKHEVNIMQEENKQKQDMTKTEESLQVSFNFNDVEEKRKFQELAKLHGITQSALLRMLVLREWRIEIGNIRTEK